MSPEVHHGTFPPDFVTRMRELVGAEADALLAALRAPAVGLRVNTLKVTPERFLEISPLALRRLAFPPEGFVVAGGPRPGRHPYHAAGLYYLQDPCAMAVGVLVSPRPGERVLDLAAAPGGKATHLAALLEDRGLLVANDVHPGRARELAGNLERLGATRAVVTSEAPRRLAERWGAVFDRVLVDAPCSGEAMFARSEAARQEWSASAVLGCARRQGELLAAAARLVRPGGLLVYSTCTFSPEEDEGTIARFLDAQPDFGLESLPAISGGGAGRPEWGGGDVERPELSRALRLWPHRTEGAGHFVAALRRGEGDVPPVAAAGREAPADALRRFESFRGSVLPGAEAGEGLTLAGAELHRVPEGTPSLERLRVLRPGWWLGTVHRDRFEPAHALAMAVRREDADEPVELDVDGPAAAAYLAGEPLRLPGRAGWVLTTVSGYPVGWGKRVGDVVKNHYPKGLRRR